MATVPLPHQFAVGEVVTADNINTYYSGVAFLENPPHCVMYQVAAQSLVTATLTAIIFDTNEVDSYNGHSLITNPTRYTGQVPGYYECSGVVGYAASNTSFRLAGWFKNGTAVAAATAVIQCVTIGGVGTNVTAPTREIFLNGTTDYVELFAEHNIGAGLNTATSAGQQSMATIRWVHA